MATMFFATCDHRCHRDAETNIFFFFFFNWHHNMLQPASYFSTTGVAFCYIAHGFVIFATTGHKKSCVRRRDLLQRPWRSSIAHGAPASSSDEHAGERADEHAGERADEHAGERRLRRASRRAAPARKPTSKPTSRSCERLRRARRRAAPASGSNERADERLRRASYRRQQACT